MSFEQVRVYQLHQIEMPRIARRFEVQFECDRLYDFVWRYARIGDVGGLNVLRQPRLQHIAQHGFAAADFAGHLDDALALADRIDQRFEYGPTVSAAEKEIGRFRCGIRAVVEAAVPMSTKRLRWYFACRSSRDVPYTPYQNGPII